MQALLAFISVSLAAGSPPFNVSDDNPEIAIVPGGGFVLTWLKGGKLLSAKNFQMTSPVTIMEDQYSTNLADFKLALTPTGSMAMVWAEPSEYASDIYAAFYDPIFDAWGAPKRLTSDNETEKYLAPAFLGNRDLMIVYDRTKVDVKAESRQTATGKEFSLSVPEPITTDLYMLRYRMGGDLALDKDTFVATPLNPHPGEAVTFRVKALNLGDVAASDIPIAFYDANPSSKGKEIGRKTVSDLLKPGDSAEVTTGFLLTVKKVPTISDSRRKK